MSHHHPTACVCVGLGTMPSAMALGGIPRIAHMGADARTMGTDPRTSTGTDGHAAMGTDPRTATGTDLRTTTGTVRCTATALGGGEAAGISIAPTGESASALMANLLPQANSGLASIPQGVYVGEGLPPVPGGDFVDMAELLPEFWALPRDEDGGKSEARSRRARSVQDIFTWLQCFGLYVSVLAPLYPERIAELMAYQSTIVRASQDYAGLAWMRYDSAFRRQAALTGLVKWSAINPTIYTLCFAGITKTATRCDLCFTTTHSTQECAQQGDPDLGVRERLRAIEKAVLSMSPAPTPPPRTGWTPRASGQVCRLWNANQCTYYHCKHTHVCSRCAGPHPALSCTRPVPQSAPPPTSAPPSSRRASGGAARPY